MKDLNLMPSKYLEIKKRKQNKKVFIIYSWLGVALLTIAVAIPLTNNYTLKLERDKLNQQIASTNKFVEKEKQFSIIQNSFDIRRKQADSLNNVGVNVLEILKSIENILPQSISFKSVNISADKDKNVKISLSGGEAASNDDVASLISHIKTIKYYSSMNISGLDSANKDKKSDKNSISFSLTINLKVGK